MRGCRERMRGSVAVEFALVLPFLVVLVVGGWTLGYIAYSKLALSMAANRAARDLAASLESYGEFKQTGQPYRYDGGFAESFGLPRWGIHAVAMKSKVGDGKGVPDHALQVALCYRVPFAIPFGATREPEPPRRYLPDTGAIEEGVIAVADLVEAEELEQAVQEYQQLKREVEEEAAAWERLGQKAGGTLEELKDVAAKLEWVATLVEALFKPPEASLQSFGKGGLSPDKLEQRARELCEPAPARLKGRSIILTSRSAYLMQEVFRPNGAGEKGAKPVKKGGKR